MGMLVEGRWTEQDTTVEAGAFVRRLSVHRKALGAEVVDAIVSDPGRFHLIASLSCPWSHRTTILRTLKGLADAVPLQIAGGRRVEGYPANGGRPWRVPGTEMRIIHLHELYRLSDPGYSGRASVPVLWDRRDRRVVSNESAAIMRVFDAVPRPRRSLDFTLVPEPLRGEIDALNATLHEGLSDAVYRAGLAQRQDAYDSAVAQVFATLDALERRLVENRYLFGAIITETDWRLFPTLVRFDAVYHSHFRCTRRRLVDYPTLWAYARDLYAWRGIAETVDLAAIRAGYYQNDGVHNPFGIVAAAPDADWMAPHGRDALAPAQVALCGGETRTVDPRRFGGRGG
ncbi:MAG: glutathione S-transferase C-terminal domain-containing protein [Alphaproteobacteria bacterium]|nr:glutathione S-transferase C-terminal domain-containing protein [Alphaproteobacteria bacterium]